MFLTITPYSESDYESSDGGEYIPDEDGEDTEDIVDTDGYPSSDIDFDADVDEMGVEDWDALHAEHTSAAERTASEDNWLALENLAAAEFSAYYIQHDSETANANIGMVDAPVFNPPDTVSGVTYGFQHGDIHEMECNDEDEEDGEYIYASMSESGSSTGGLTDGCDTLSEGDLSMLATLDDGNAWSFTVKQATSLKHHLHTDTDAYAGDVSMASGDDDDDSNLHTKITSSQSNPMESLFDT